MMLWARIAIAVTNMFTAAIGLFAKKREPKAEPKAAPKKAMTLQEMAESLEPGESVVQTKSKSTQKNTPLERPVIPPNPYGVEN